MEEQRDMAVTVRSGTRLRSAVCDTEIIVVRAQAGEVDLRCGGRPMLPHGSAAAERAVPEPGYDQPTLLGKRYTDDADTIEVLCTVAGSSTLSLGERPLSVKGPRPLPASD
jgi:hypothetical protein